MKRKKKESEKRDKSSCREYCGGALESLSQASLKLRANIKCGEGKRGSVKLDEHVGHTVTVTGVVAHQKAHAMKEDTKAEMKEHGMDEGAKEHGHLTVADLTMVSDTCPK
jgi:hypothetical protein